MSWADAERYNRILRDAETELDRSPGAAVPWRDEYADVFAGPHQLCLALLGRWKTILEAQGEDVSLEQLATAHPGLAGLTGARPPRRTRCAWACARETALAAS